MYIGVYSIVIDTGILQPMVTGPCAAYHTKYIKILYGYKHSLLGFETDLRGEKKKNSS